MRVVWTWKDDGKLFDYRKDTLCCLDKYQLLLLVASFVTWHRYYPEDELVFYCDENTSNFLFEEGTFLENYLNFNLNIKQEIVDFSKVQKQYSFSNNSWSWPKMYTGGLQDEPFIMVDRDILVLDDFKKFLNLNAFWCYCNYCKSNTRYGWSKKVYEQFGGFIRPGMNGIHTCLVYFPKPILAKLAVINLLEESQRIERHLKQEEQNWIWQYSLAIEEWALADILEGFKVDIQEIPDNCRKSSVIHINKKNNFTEKEYRENIDYLTKLIGISDSELLKGKVVEDPTLIKLI